MIPKIDIALVRMDKIGDLVLSLTADEHPAIAGQRVHWLITKGLSFITEQSAPKRAATEFARGFSPVGFFRMVKWFRAAQPRTVILLHNPWWVSCAAWWADVPERVGRLSQWHSFLFLNVGVRQSRSEADRHESDYNFDLIEMAFRRLGVRRTLNLSVIKKSYLQLQPPNPAATVAARKLQRKSYRVVHPGMGGSALNWPVENYRLLIEALAEEDPVVITGTKSDHVFLKGLAGVQEHPNVHWLVDQVRPSELLDLLSQAKSVIAPSTGVLHLAAALGTPSLGLYSPRRVEHPRRWGPKGPRVRTLVPATSEGGAQVMSEITPDLVLEMIAQLEVPLGSSAREPTLTV